MNALSPLLSITVPWIDVFEMGGGTSYIPVFRSHQSLDKPRLCQYPSLELYHFNPGRTVVLCFFLILKKDEEEEKERRKRKRVLKWCFMLVILAP